MTTSFVPYPEIEDSKFYETIFKKKEFYKTLTGPEFHARKGEDVCNPTEFKLQNHQEFVRNFISPETPYNGILLFHGTGVGKCVHPETRVYISDTGKTRQISHLWREKELTYQAVPDPEVPSAWWIDLDSESDDQIFIETLTSKAPCRLQKVAVKRLYRQYIDEDLVELQTSCGASIKITGAHKLLTPNGWTNKLVVGSQIAYPVLDGSYNFTEITKINLVKYQGYVYDLEVPETHNYVANGLICHNTCAAISITEGLREYAHKMGKKIYIISSSGIRENFYNALYDEHKAAREKRSHSPAGSFQCAGDAFALSELEYPDPEKRLKAIRRTIRQYYSFYGPHEFANYVDIKLKKQSRMTDDEIAEMFMNSVFVIDEAHGIAGKGKLDVRKGKKVQQEEQEAESDQQEQQQEQEDQEGEAEIIGKKTARAAGSDRSLLKVLLDVIKDCRKLNGNIKLILLTATPMKDQQSELADLLELLNANDGREFNRKVLFPTDDSYNEEYLREAAKGYISYIRGNNLITFPKALLPPKEQLYDPYPLFSYDNDHTVIPESEYRVVLGTSSSSDVYYQYNLAKCPMSLYQFKAFKLFREQSAASKKGKLTGDAADTTGRQVSNFVYPSVNILDVLYDSELPDITNFNEYFGKKGLLQNFDTITTDLAKSGDEGGAKSRAKHISYEYKESTLANYGLFLMSENPVNQVNLSDCSRKIDNIVNNINNSPGIAYAYSEFDYGGARILALAMEANGYIRYSPLIKYDNKGLPSNLDKVPQARLLSYTKPTTSKLYKEYLKRNYRCAVCGKLFDQCQAEGSHKFVQATYMLFTGENSKKKMKSEIDITRSPPNMYGHVVKAIIGTRVTGEGLDFKWIRQVHIIDPWHNNTRIYQAIGRGIRYCSHVDLPPDERNVVVFKYSSAVPELTIDSTYITEPRTQLEVSETEYDQQIIAMNNEDEEFYTGVSYRDLLTETMDEKVYNRVVRKDIYIKGIERQLKLVSVDCNLSKNINYYGETDEDFSRDCEYQKCDYQCVGFPSLKYIDVSLRVTAGLEPEWFVKSNYYSEGDDWHNVNSEEGETLLEVIVGDVDNLIDIGDHDEKLTNEQLAGLLFRRLESLIGKAKVKSDGSEEITYQLPLISQVDSSTYNVHFAQPQINKARMQITKLFLFNVALTEKTIIHMISKNNPLLDVEFIKSALDQLVGHPPYIAPKEVRDRYNRPGHIIFIGGYYVFQPFDIRDKTVPIYYRVNPLTVKKQYLKLDTVVPESVIETKTSHRLEIDRLDSTINELLETANSITDPVEYILTEIDIRTQMDNMLMLDQEYILQQVLLRRYNNPDDPEYLILSEILSNYYKVQSLMYDLGDTIFTLFGATNEIMYLRKTPSGARKEVSWFTTKYSDATDKLHEEVTNTVMPEVHEKFYGFLTVISPKVTNAVEIISNRKLSHDKISQTFKNLNSYFRNSADLAKLRFKVLQAQDSNKKETSSRNKNKGVACSSIKASTIEKETRALLDELDGKTIYETPFYGPVTITRDIMDKMGSGDSAKEKQCAKLEKILRIYDLLKIQGKKWFMTPYETEYYRPIKEK